MIRFPGRRAPSGDQSVRAALRRPIGVLFVCRTQEVLSPMAAGLARIAFAPLHVHVQSAGLHPRAVDRRAVEVMGEIGLDISRTPAVAVRSLDIAAFAVVVSIGVHKLGLTRGQRAMAWPAPELGRLVGADAHCRIREMLEMLSIRIDGLAAVLAAASGD